MTKVEFLTKLKESLNNDLTGVIVQENIAYYDQYIADEIRKGRSEQEVLDELGDPWVIAQTIIDTQENAKEQGYGDRKQNYHNSYQETYAANETKKNNLSNIGRWILTIVGILGVLFIVVSVIGGLLRLFMPILIPLILVMVISRVIKRR